MSRRVVNQLYVCKEIVKEILEEFPIARDSDNVLYSLVYTRIGKQKGVDLQQVNVVRFFVYQSEYGFPTTETVRRTRQKLQQEFPELRSSKAVQKFKAENEEMYKEFARDEEK